uniref:Uncharacterized protein n=1 Tax=Oryza brachyantha TaxID=4533 RepID=J3KZP2_ORYBR
VEWRGGEAARALRRQHVLGEVDVALVAPVVAPRVLGDPVLVAADVLAVADHGDGVVHPPGVAGAPEHAALVELELRRAHVDVHSHRLPRPPLPLVVGRHGAEPGHGRRVAGQQLAHVAAAAHAGVGVRLLRRDAAAGGHQAERRVGVAAAAAEAPGVAVHHHLLRHRHQLAGLDLVEALDGRRRRERPARRCH